MLSTGYQFYSFSEVTNLANFYKEKLPEMLKVKSLVEGIKLLFSVPSNCIKVYVAEGERVYKITILESNLTKVPIGYFVYIPEGRRLDVYTIDSYNIPFIQWQGKNIMHKQYSLFLDKLGISKLFNKLVNII